MLAEQVDLPGAPAKAAAPQRPSRGARLAPFAVWGTWAVLFVALLAFVAHFARNVPFSDDWDIMPWVSGERPVDASWLWAPYHEHRIPLPKLLWVALGRLTGCDVRAGMYLNCVILAGLSAAMICAARRLRGRTAFPDALFPLALLHWGQHQNILWDFGTQFVCSTAFAISLLLVLLRVRGAPTPWQSAVAGLCLLGLPLCGANGLLLVPLPALWLIASCLAPGRIGSRAGRVVGPILAAGALLLAAACLLGESGVGSHPVSPSPTATVQTACQFLVMCVGPVAEAGLPVSAFLLLLLLAGCGIAVAAGLRRTGDFWRGCGLLCYLFAFLGLALAIGWGRAGAGGVTAAYGSRFVTLAAPLLCWCYFAALMLPNSRGPLRWLPAGLCVVVLGLFPWNMREGFSHGQGNATLLTAVEADIRRGTQPRELAPRWDAAIYPPGGHADYLRDRLEWLRTTRQGPYKGVDNYDPPAR
jgi:hypothetical protein